MRHLVTGGAGFIGSALAKRLLAEGHDVTVLDRFSRGRKDRLPQGIEMFAGDIRGADIVRHAVWGQDVIWHLAYVQGTQTFYADPKDVIDVALRGIMNVLDACEAFTTAPVPYGGKLNKPPDLFLVSSSEVYQNPPEGMYPTDETVPLSVPDVTNPRYSYGGGKIASELATFAYAQVGILNRAVIVRPHNIYGPDMGHEHVIPEFADRMAMAEAMPRVWDFEIQGTGQETRSFCYIQDAIDGLMVLLHRAENRQVYHLGNPNEEYTISELAHRMANWFGLDIRVQPGKLPEGSPVRRAPDIHKMQALGFKPIWDLDQGLAHTLPWYQQQAAA